MKLICGVSGINTADNPGPGFGIVRSILEIDSEVKCFGLAYDALEPGIYLRDFIEKSFLMPYPSGGREPYLNRLMYIKENYGLDLVISALDSELPLYIESKEQLAEAGIRTFLPDKEHYDLRAKDKLVEVADCIGIEYPNTRVAKSLEEFISAVSEIGFPLLVKGIFYRAYRCHHYQQALQSFDSLVAEWGYPVLVQKAVNGEEMNVIGLGDGEGGSLGLVGLKKLTVTAQGKIWTAVSVKNEPMLEAARKFVKKFKWRGGFELECIVQNDDVYLIEINPRFPAWVYFATALGINLPYRLLLTAMGKDVDRGSDYEAGKLFVRYTDELICDMDLFQKMATRGEA
ncbi:MAG: ATP-grasp domain-containing protein [Candidatus Wallbacteria bacterium]|nr:ATP-grasp domain-containing protein [Candidatus Wallbacteria bacterium]